MVVVQDEQEELLHLLGQLIGQRGGDGAVLPRGVVHGAQEGRGARAEAGEALAQAEQEVLEEAAGVGVRGVEGQPADGEPLLAGLVGEVHQEGSLPVAGWGDDQLQAPVEVTVQEIEELPPAHRPRSPAGDEHLGDPPPAACACRLTSLPATFPALSPVTIAHPIPGRPPPLDEDYNPGPCSHAP